MAIDEDMAWAALLAARDAWRPDGPGAMVVHGGLELSPALSWRATGPAAPTRAARDLLDFLLPLLAPRIAFAQLGQSLDGRIATASGHSHYVTGPRSLLHLHRLRALADAVVVGAGTVLADDPRLTVRLCAGPNPLRVVIDTRGGLRADRHVFADGAAPTLVLRPGGAVAPGRAEVAALPRGQDGFDARAVLDLLAARGARRVLVEGGGATVSRFLAAGALDALHVVVAPMLIGSGRQGIDLPAISTLDAALRPRTRHLALGEDMLFELRLP
jgi:riboflavin-specific deaminase-like protein